MFVKVVVGPQQPQTEGTMIVRYLLSCDIIWILFEVTTPPVELVPIEKLCPRRCPLGLVFGLSRPGVVAVGLERISAEGGRI